VVDEQYRSTVGPPELVEVTPGVLAYIQPDGSWMLNNTGAVVGGEAVLMIDTTSTERRNRRLWDVISEATGERPVRTLINTHHHGDHTFGNWMMPASTTIVAHRLCRDEMLRAGLAAMALFPTCDYGHVEVALPTMTFDADLSLWVDDLEIRASFVGPAHTLGDVFVWVPERRVVFTGDLVFHGGHPFLVEGCLSNYPQALARLQALGAEILVPGHGPVATPAVLDDMLAYAAWLTQVAAEGFAHGWEPLETARRADLDRFAHWAGPERLVGNLHRAYAELRGEKPGAPLNLAEVMTETIEFNGGPLRCLA
jgi:glyoxylase-like metal-dependent hydrolase (beta-lactamase superfamily II)